MKYLWLTTLLVAAVCVSYCRKSCPACNRPKEEIKQRKVQTILKEILDKLNLPILPNITRNNIPPIPGILNLQESNVMEQNMEESEPDEDNYHSKTERIILFPDQEHLPVAESSAQKCCYFHFVGKVTNPSLRIHKAKLEVYVRRKVNGSNIALAGQSVNSTINVYQRGFPVTNGITRKTLIASKRLNPRRQGSWYMFNIKSVVKHWKRHPHLNLGLELEIQGDNSSYAIAQGKHSSYQPFLEIFIRNKKKRRRKRRAELVCGAGSREKRCCRYPLIIDFNELGSDWDFVIAPRRFMANYCSGQCDETILPQYLHGHLVRKMTGKRDVVCCAPNNSTSINLIYFENDKSVTFDRLDSMVAVSCGCL